MIRCERCGRTADRDLRIAFTHKGDECFLHWLCHHCDFGSRRVNECPE